MPEFAARAQQETLRKELGLRDLVLAQVLCVVGTSWGGIAAKLGRAHVVFWLAAILLFYVPLAAVVIQLNRRMPLAGVVYLCAKEGFVEMVGSRTFSNTRVFAVTLFVR